MLQALRNVKEEKEKMKCMMQLIVVKVELHRCNL